jgi:hypothetical protein
MFHRSWNNEYENNGILFCYWLKGINMKITEGFDFCSVAMSGVEVTREHGEMEP